MSERGALIPEKVGALSENSGRVGARDGEIKKGRSAQGGAGKNLQKIH